MDAEAHHEKRQSIAGLQMVGDTWRSVLKIDCPGPESGIPPVFVGERSRYGTVTSVQFLSDDLAACGSFDGRRIDLVAVGERTTPRLLHSIPGTYKGRPVQNDLLGASPNGEFFATSNFHSGSSSLYTHDGERVSSVRDLPFHVPGFVHGVRFYDDNTLALTACSGPRGVHFFDIHSGEHRLGVAIPSKCQDIAFLSPNRMLVLAVTGNPGFRPFPIYDSQIWVVDFDLKTRRAKVHGGRLYKQCHFDAGRVHKGYLYLTDQYNNTVEVLKPDTLEVAARLTGYDFPHGMDIRNDRLAVTNYGASTLEIRPIPPMLLAPQSVGASPMDASMAEVGVLSIPAMALGQAHQMPVSGSS
jgi:hypothetical protein